jgi:hypothetical protein
LVTPKIPPMPNLVICASSKIFTLIGNRRPCSLAICAKPVGVISPPGVLARSRQLLVSWPIICPCRKPCLTEALSEPQQLFLYKLYSSFRFVFYKFKNSHSNWPPICLLIRRRN